MFVNPEPASSPAETTSPQTRHLHHINRLYAVLCEVNRAMTLREGRQELLQNICRILVEVGGFRMAWIGLPDADGWLTPQAIYGDNTEYLSTIRISCRDVPQWQSPAGVAIREKRPVIVHNIQANPLVVSWHAQAMQHGFNSIAGFPVSFPSGAMGSISLYSTECDFFSPEEEKLLMEISNDIGYALEFIASEEQRSATGEHFRIIFENATEGIIVTNLDDNDFIMVNPAICTMFGFSEAEFLRLTMSQLHPPESLHKVQAEFMAMATGKKTGSFHIPCLRKNGTLFYANVAASPMALQGKRCLVSFFTDITEQKNSEDELRVNEQKFRAFGEAAQNAVIQLDSEGKVCFWNSAAERMFGYRAEEILGRSMHQLLAPSRFRDAYGSAKERFALTGDGPAVNQTLELAALRKNGEEFPMELSLSSFKSSQGWNALGIVRDITQRKQSETLLRQQAELLQQEVNGRRKVQELLLQHQSQLQTLNSELEARVAEEVQKSREKDQVLIQREKMASLGQLAAGVAHEINNPMAFIAGNLNVLARYYEDIACYDRLIQEQLPELEPRTRAAFQQNRALMKIERILTDGVELVIESLDGAERVAQIVRDLKNFSRVDALEQEPATLTSCLESALTIARNELKYVATIRKEYGTVPEILCNPGHLNQLFLNLLINADHAIIPPGEITLKSWCDEEFVYASVGDTGRGIPEEVRNRIFEPFFTTKDVGEGTGLGLSIAHEIVKNHNGSILVESEVGSGTTFTVVLPRLPEEE
jgi:PAS domain S-box-containing protein